MKIALMSGAYVNAGDFLIEDRSRRLLEKFIGQAEVHILKRDVSYDGRLEELQAYDRIVFGGGPGYQRKLYPDAVPFVSDLSRLKTPVAIMGWGWKGKGISEKSLYGKGNQLSGSMARFVRNAENSGGGLGCRDWYTVRYLKNQGFRKCRMTGCPAWYDLDYMEGLHAGRGRAGAGWAGTGRPCICISDAAFPHHKWMMGVLAAHMRGKYPRARIRMVFHRGITDKDRPFTSPLFLERYRLEYVDISGSADGFCIYDACDLHIGFRVHAHIYNLSRGKASILVNEDARGYGVNDALGIQNISLRPRGILAHKAPAHGDVAIFRKTLDDYFGYLSDTGFLQYENACSNLQYYYGEMQRFIREMADG